MAETDDDEDCSGSWTQEDVAPFVIAGMDDANGQRIRSSAVALAVTMYQTVGMEAMQPLLAQLRPAKQALLKQKFQEAEEEEGAFCGGTPAACAGIVRKADFGGLVVCGNAVKPPPGYRLEPLPGAPPQRGDYDEEESLMDGILEEVGMVFSGTGIVNEEARRRELYGGAGRNQQQGGQGFTDSMMDTLGLDLADEDQRLLEEELMNLGMMDLEEELDEQQALFSSLQNQPMGRARSVEVC